MVATSIYLIRHAETTWNAERRMQGRLDAPLSERGVHQLAALARAMRSVPLTAAYASPLGRAVRTARAVAEPHGVPVRTLDALSEMDQGGWESKLMDEIEAHDGPLLRAWWDTPDAVRMPDGESLQDVQARALHALGEIVARHPGQHVSVVAHGGVNKTLLLWALGAPLASYWRIRQHNACINHIDVDATHARVLTLNDTAHLADDGVWQLS
jgi:broad specificity phosphatase PhoE